MAPESIIVEITQKDNKIIKTITTGDNSSTTLSVLPIKKNTNFIEEVIRKLKLKKYENNQM